jgi:hypothetical protein
MWVKLSQANIFPGLKLCDELSVTVQDPISMRRKVAQLEAWSQEASSRIYQIAREVSTHTPLSSFNSICCTNFFSARNNRRSYPGWKRGLKQWQRRPE